MLEAELRDEMRALLRKIDADPKTAAVDGNTTINGALVNTGTGGVLTVSNLTVAGAPVNPGTYTIRCMASDGALNTPKDVVVTVK